MTVTEKCDGKRMKKREEGTLRSVGGGMVGEELVGGGARVGTVDCRIAQFR